MPEKPRHFGSRSPEYALLGFLYEQPSHGYTLHQELVNELGHVWHASQSQTYAILKRLEARGDISSTTEEQEKLPARQLLQITPAGRRRFEEWLHAASGSSVRAIRLEFITRLYFAQKLFPEMIQTILGEEAADIDKALTRLEKDRKSIPPDQTFNRLGLELRIQQLYSVRDWLIECRKAFEIKV
ncbi:MAG TPA: PadR family transcriptional regulator [Anaerolineales bacterium]|nr:PadR family transcriptional regulator [Anaerolineales bacterium]